eukprot:CFRG8208T1
MGLKRNALRAIGALTLSVCVLAEVTVVRQDSPAPEFSTIPLPVVPDTPVKVFTHEWQTLAKNQPIPPGLHVRMDFQTGIRHAKLMDPEPTPEVALMLVEHEEAEPVEEAHRNEHDEWPDHDKIDDDVVKLSFEELATEDMPLPSKKWKSTLMELSSLRILKLTDEETSLNERLRILVELEEDLHDIEHADTFFAAGGVKLLVELLGHSDSTIRSSAALAFGSCVQSNRPLQTHAHTKLNAVDNLITLLNHALKQVDTDIYADTNIHATTGVNDTPTHLASIELHNSLYALSSLVGFYPDAYRRLVLYSPAVDVLRDIFTHPNTRHSDRVKVLSILGDILVSEAEFRKPHLTDDGEEHLGKDFSERLLDRLGGQSDVWCIHASSMLKAAKSLDDNQKLLAALTRMSPACMETFTTDTALKSHVEDLILRWQQEMDSDDDETWKSYLLGVKDVASNFLSILS